MKKSLIFLILIMLFSVSCSKLVPKKSGTRIKKIEENKTPVPEFTDIEKYIRSSYENIDIDEVRRETYIEQSPQLDVTMKDLILRGRVVEGMYKEDVFASLGKPENKVQYTTDFGIKEEWIYEKSICHFENGVLKAIEEK